MTGTRSADWQRVSFAQSGHHGDRRLAEPQFVAISGGIAVVGSSIAEVEECVDEWAGSLADARYTPAAFREWISKEVPRHAVRLSPYELGRFPVTNGEYWPFVSNGTVREPESIAAGEPDGHPVWGVSYEDAERFAAAATDFFGAICRLPTEAEWEHAARGPLGLRYPFGESFSAMKCNTLEAGIRGTTPVDRYAEYASPFGVCDLAGNVEEWTSTTYSPYPDGAYVFDDLVARTGPDYRILRGGSFARSGDLARCARRHGPHPDPVFRYRGFRLVREQA